MAPVPVNRTLPAGDRRPTPLLVALNRPYAGAVPRITVNGNELYYEERGHGTALLGIHGTPSSAMLWEDAAEELSAYGRCITYDRRGFLRSAPSPPPATLDLAEHVADAVGLLDALSARSAIVVGRSTGGLIALELAHRHPDRVQALVLLEPAVFSLDPAAAEWAGQLRNSILKVAAEHPESAAEIVLRLALGDEAWESFPWELHHMFSETSPAVLAELTGQGLDLSENPLVITERELAAMMQPTLLVSAEDSAVPLWLANDRLAEALPDARKVLVSGGHLINPAHPAVLEFIRRVLAS